MNPFTTVKWVELATDVASGPANDPLFTSDQNLSVASDDSSGIDITALDIIDWLPKLIDCG